MSSIPQKLKTPLRAAIHAFVAAVLAFTSLAVDHASAQGTLEKRLAFVIGNAAYKTGPLATPANDAGLIAQTLQAAGFDVVGARDLDRNGLHDAMRDFLAKANAAGPNAVIFVYLAGYGVQYQGENYFAPIDAQIGKAADVPVETLRVSDLTKALAAIDNRGSIVVLDAARTNFFVASDQPLAGGLALVDADANQLIAFNAMPGTVGPAENGPYGAYAHALAETMRNGGLALADLFDRTRLRVGELTKGTEISWDADRFKTPFQFFARAANAPAASAPAYSAANMTGKSIRDFDEHEAYFAALYRDTLAGYEDFLAAYPDDAMARRVRAIIATRREAITWHETWVADTPQAYWSYLRRYPHGPHRWDARRRLSYLQAELDPPPTFTVIAYDVPPPPPTEIVYVERPVLVFDDRDFGYAPPPPVVFLAPQPRDFVVLPPPPPPVGLYVLPTPAYVPVPDWVEPPPAVEPPRDNVIFKNIHNTVVNETVVNNTTVVNENGAAAAPAPAAGMTTQEKIAGAALAAGAGAAALHVALPPSLQKKIQHLDGKTQTAAPQAAAPAQPATQPAPKTPVASDKNALPGANGKPRPATGKMPEPKEQNSATKPLPANPAQARPAVAAPVKSAGESQTNAHALPGANGELLPAPGKTPPAAKPKQSPANSQPANPPVPAGETLADTHALPGANGKALPPVKTEPAPKKPKPAVQKTAPADLKPATPPSRPKAPDVSEKAQPKPEHAEPRGANPHAARVAKAPRPEAEARPKPAPHAAPAKKLPLAKENQKPKPVLQPRMTRQKPRAAQASRPQAPKPPKPARPHRPAPKKCGNAKHGCR